MDDKEKEALKEQPQGQYVTPTVTRLGGLVAETKGSGNGACELGETKKAKT